MRRHSGAFCRQRRQVVLVSRLHLVRVKSNMGNQYKWRNRHGEGGGVGHVPRQHHHQTYTSINSNFFFSLVIGARPRLVLPISISEKKILSPSSQGLKNHFAWQQRLSLLLYSKNIFFLFLAVELYSRHPTPYFPVATSPDTGTPLQARSERRTPHALFARVL